MVRVWPGPRETMTTETRLEAALGWLREPSRWLRGGVENLDVTAGRVVADELDRLSRGNRELAEARVTTDTDAERLRVDLATAHQRMEAAFRAGHEAGWDADGTPLTYSATEQVALDDYLASLTAETREGR